MKEGNDHFLDTCILLTNLISWNKEDLYSSANKYFNNSNYRKITSKKVFLEAKTVINRTKSSIIRFLRYIYKNLRTISFSNSAFSMLS